MDFLYLPLPLANYVNIEQSECFHCFSQIKIPLLTFPFFQLGVLREKGSVHVVLFRIMVCFVDDFSKKIEHLWGEKLEKKIWKVFGISLPHFFFLLLLLPHLHVFPFCWGVGKCGGRSNFYEFYRCCMFYLTFHSWSVFSSSGLWAVPCWEIGRGQRHANSGIY